MARTLRDLSASLALLLVLGPGCGGSTRRPGAEGGPDGAVASDGATEADAGEDPTDGGPSAPPRCEARSVRFEEIAFDGRGGRPRLREPALATTRLPDGRILAVFYDARIVLYDPVRDEATVQEVSFPLRPNGYPTKLWVDASGRPILLLTEQFGSGSARNYEYRVVIGALDLGAGTYSTLYEEARSRRAPGDSLVLRDGRLLWCRPTAAGADTWSCHLFDPESATLSAELATFAAPVFPGLELQDGTVLLGGGSPLPGTHHQILDLASGAVRETARRPVERMAGSTQNYALLGTGHIVRSGRAYREGTMPQDQRLLSLIYRPEDDRWTEAAPPPRHVDRGLLTPTPDGRGALLSGGYPRWREPPYLTDLLYYDEAGDCWRRVGWLGYVYGRHDLYFLDDGRVVVPFATTNHEGNVVVERSETPIF